MGNLGHIAGIVTLDINPFKVSSSALTSAIRATDSAMKAQERSLKAYGNSINGMKSKYSMMQQQMSNYDAELKEQKKTYDEVASKTGKITQAQANAAGQYNKTKAKAIALEAEMRRLGLQISQQDNKWYKAGQAATKFGNTAQAAGQRMNSMGTKLTTNVTAPIIAGLGYAARASIKFNSEIKQIGPLLTNGAAVTGKFKAQLDQMAASSKRWSVQFGVSTTDINSGLSEMVKRGYSASQAMGAMPAVLNATRASGDDFNTVMHSTTAVLEQFGLKSNNTAKMVQNTSHVTDVLTHVANATASGFQDMGDAMSYVGPTSHAAGLSLEQTAAALGLMSNNGIEGSMAGTTLRGVLQKLMNPSKQSAAALEQMGVSAEAFKNHTLTLPQLIDKIKTNTQGWTKEQRAAAISAAFGARAQAGMNVLVDQGSGALNKLTKAAKNSNGETANIAKTMNETSAAKVQRMKESLNVLAINIGDKVVPAIMPLIDSATKMVQGFGNMDDATQKNIVKWLALAAVAGPAFKIFGSGISTIGGIAKVFGAGATALSRFQTASSAGAKGFDLLKAGLSQGAFDLGKFGVGAATAEQAATGLGAAAVESGSGMAAAGTAGTGLLATLAPFAPVILGIGAAVGIGFAAWKLWGEGAYNASQRTERWGSDVGVAADKSLTKMQNFNAQATTALHNFGDSAVVSGNQASKAFQGMGKEIENVGKKANRDLTKGLKDLPSDVQSIVNSSVQKQKAGNNKIVAQSKTLSSNVAGVLKTHNGNVKQLTDEQRTYIENSQQQLNQNEVKLLGIGGKQKANVLRALNGDVKNLTQQQAQSTFDTLQRGVEKEVSLYEKNSKTLKNQRNKGLITEKQYSQAVDALQKDHKKKLQSNLGGISQLETEYGLVHGTNLDNIMSKEKISWDEVDKTLEKAQKNHKVKLSSIAQEYGDLNKVQQQTGKEWNRMVLDPKTGKIKTDAQKTLNETASTEQGWEKLKFDAKHAKIDSNAKAMVAVAAIENGRWEDMSWKDKKALLAVKGDKELEGMVKRVKDWDKLKPKQQEAIVKAKGKEELTQAMISAGEWNNLTIKQQKASVKSEGARDLIDLMDKTGKWNDLDPKTQKAVIEGKGSGELLDQTLKLKKWDDLTPKEKKLLVGGNAKQKIVESLIQSKTWNDLTMVEKDAVVKDKATANLVKSLDKSGEWDKLTFEEKDTIVKDKATVGIISSLNSVGKWKGIDVKAKDAIVNDKASAPIVSALVQTGEWQKLKPEEKDAIINTKNSPMELANLVAAYGGFNELPDSQKNLIINNASARQKLVDSGILINNYNAKKVPIKSLKGDNKDAVNKLKVGQSTIATYNGKQVTLKKLKGDKVSIDGAVNGAKGSISGYNNKGVDTKNLKGTSKSVKSAAADAMAAIKSWNATKVVTKFFNGIFGSKKKATGDSDFEGGLATVNDQKGSLYRELIIPPDGPAFMFGGRDVTVPLKRHTQIVPARQTSQFLNNSGIPKFANGTPGYSKSLAKLSNLSPSLLNAGDTYNSNTTEITNNESFFDEDSFIEKLTAGIVQAMSQIQSQQVVVMDGEPVGRIVTKTVNEVSGRQIENRRRGQAQK